MLAGVSLKVRQAELLTIVGGSGAGKTTLLRALGGLLDATAGEVLVHGRPLGGRPPEGVVVVFQDYSRSLLPWRTVAQNVALGLEADRVPRAERRERIDEALTLVGLERNAHQFPWQLSGGMQQRLQIARALAVGPDSLLMDEPFGSLDAITKAALQDELLQLHRRTHTTIVFVTHDVDEAVYLGDRVVVLAGSPATVTRELRVDLPRPRNQLETRELPEFIRLRHEIFQTLASTIAGRRDRPGPEAASG